jgi:hypothetical protein
MRIRLAVLGLLLALFTLTPALSLAQQDAEPIAYGEAYEGRLRSSETQHWYVFEGRRGDRVTISVTSDDTDVVVQLGNEQLDVIAENDDISRNNLNALIEDVELPADGTYYILVRAYDRGNYTLSLEGRSGSGGGGSSGGSSSASNTDLTPIAYGDRVQGQAIDLETPALFTFSGRAGDTLFISVTSDAIDPYVVLADMNGDTIAENDDIEKNNLNSYIEATLPATGDYLIGVFGYSAGPFTLELGQGSGGSTPVVDSQSNEDIAQGEITNRDYFVSYDLPDVREGDTITVETRALSGDLDLYVGLFFGDNVVAENDDREQGTFDAALEYPQAQAGDYTVVVTRYGFEDGNTTGEFEIAIKVSAGSSLAGSGGGGITSNPVAAGYPNMNPTPSIAEWTVLAYLGADNNLEDGLVNDLDEFERAGGSNDRVRIIVLLDRAQGFDRSNGNWTDTRIFEVGPDRSRDAAFQYPPTIDTREMANLGELDTSFGQNLLDFLVWGIRTYPAQRYAISLNDHGGAWTGIVTDDTTGHGILTMPELQTVFQSALQQTGLDKFDLMINDACLMSSVEYYAAMAPYFDYVISSPEITLNPSFDMDLMTQALNQNPAIPIPDLGELIVNKYLQDMRQLSPDTSPVLGAAVTDLRNFDTVVEAMDNFAAVFNANPQAYVSLFGQVRSNTYTYSFFLPEDQFGPATNIDVGSFMQGIVDNTRDANLRAAAEDVLRALNGVRLYAAAGPQLDRFTSYYNLYFPARSSQFQANYFQENPLQSWSLVLRGYFSNVSAGGGFRAIGAAPAAGPQGAPPLSPLDAPSVVPQVTITNLFPSEGNANVPFKVGMEVTGRNISQGIFTVDQVQPDGTTLRLDSSLIVTTVVEDGVANQINFWNPGVDDFTFTWNVELSQVTDGQTTDFELVSLNEDIYSLAGRYHPPGSEEWVDTTLIFGDDNRVSSAIARQPGTNALAPLRLEVGGEFQSYRSVVSPDGIVQTQPGTTYQITEQGISWSQEPAPDGEYNLGFLIEAFGGATGFNSTRVTVNNDGVDPTTVGYLDTDWGFLIQRPDNFSSMDYFPDGGFLQSSRNGEEYLFVYSVVDADDPEDLESIARQALDPFGTDYEGRFTQATYGDRDGLEFDYTYTNNDGDDFTGRGFVTYLEDLDIGLIFASEALDANRTAELYDLMMSTIVFFDPTAFDENDTGRWQPDRFDEDTRYSVPTDWMPGGEREGTGRIWFYSPGDDASSPVRAAVSAYPDREGTAAELRDAFIDAYAAAERGFEVIETETYYGENETWEVTTYQRDGFIGRVFATIGQNGTGYVWWFEAPEDQFNQVFDETFRIMLDSFRIADEE